MDSPIPFLPIDFCVVKRASIVLYSLRESLKYKAGRSLPVVLGYVYPSPIASSILWSLSMLLQRRSFSSSLKYHQNQAHGLIDQ
jgi:hypothetical protein